MVLNKFLGLGLQLYFAWLFYVEVVQESIIFLELGLRSHCFAFVGLPDLSDEVSFDC